MSETKQNEEKKITVSFKKAPDYKIYSATDLWGGPTADFTKIFFNLVIDHLATPSYQTFIVDDKGRINPNDVRESISSGDIEKEILCGVLLTPEDALKIGKWLQLRSEEINNARKNL